MKKIILRTCILLVLVTIASYFAGLSISELFSPVYFGLFVVGTAALVLVEYTRQRKKQEILSYTKEQVIWLSFLISFFAVFVRLMKPVYGEEIRRDILLCMRPVFYGLCIRIILNGLEDKPTEVSALEAEKEEEGGELQETPKKESQHDTGKRRELSEKERAEFIKGYFRDNGLSKREMEVAMFLLRHYSNQEIAEELFLTENTVKKHNANLYKKLGINNREQLFYEIRQQLEKAAIEAAREK